MGISYFVTFRYCKLLVLIRVLFGSLGGASYFESVHNSFRIPKSSTFDDTLKLLMKHVTNVEENFLFDWNLTEKKFRRAVFTFFGCAHLIADNISGRSGVGEKLTNDSVYYISCVFSTHAREGTFEGRPGNAPTQWSCSQYSFYDQFPDLSIRYWQGSFLVPYQEGIPVDEDFGFCRARISEEEWRFYISCQTYAFQMIDRNRTHAKRIPVIFPMPCPYDPDHFELGLESWVLDYHKTEETIEVLVHLKPNLEIARHYIDYGVFETEYSIEDAIAELYEGEMYLEIVPLVGGIIENEYDKKYCHLMVLIFILILSCIFLISSLIFKFYVDNHTSH